MKIQTNHGGEVTMITFVPQERPVARIEFLLGVHENYSFLEPVTRYFLRRNFIVHIGQNHGVSKRFDLGSKLTTPVNLNNVLLDDATAELEAVVKMNDEGLPIHLLGHSQGGLSVLALLSNSRFLKSMTDKYGYNARFEIATAMAAPDMPEDQRPFFKLACRIALPVLKEMEKRGVKTIHPLEPILDIMSFREATKGSLSHEAVYHASKAMMWVTREFAYLTLLTERVLPKKEFESLARERISPLPIGILIGAMESVLENDFLDPDDGSKLIVPERMGDYFKGVQLVTADQDVFTRVRKQAKFYEAIHAPYKRHVVLRGAKHVDPPLMGEEFLGIADRIYSFHFSPHRTARVDRTAYINMPRRSLYSMTCSAALALTGI